MEVVELVEAAGVGILLGIESAQVTDFTFRENHHNCSNRRTGTRNTHAGQAGTQAVLHIGNVVDWLNLW